jgi:hypothetical protein
MPTNAFYAGLNLEWLSLWLKDLCKSSEPCYNGQIFKMPFTVEDRSYRLH